MDMWLMHASTLEINHADVTYATEVLCDANTLCFKLASTPEINHADVTHATEVLCDAITLCIMLASTLVINRMNVSCNRSFSKHDYLVGHTRIHTDDK